LLQLERFPVGHTADARSTHNRSGFLRPAKFRPASLLRTGAPVVLHVWLIHDQPPEGHMTQEPEDTHKVCMCCRVNLPVEAFDWRNMSGRPGAHSTGRHDVCRERKRWYIELLRSDVPCPNWPTELPPRPEHPRPWRKGVTLSV
jgi:hypothetical protein